MHDSTPSGTSAVLVESNSVAPQLTWPALLYSRRADPQTLGAGTRSNQARSAANGRVGGVAGTATVVTVVVKTVVRSRVAARLRLVISGGKWEVKKPVSSKSALNLRSTGRPESSMHASSARAPRMGPTTNAISSNGRRLRGSAPADNRPPLVPGGFRLVQVTACPDYLVVEPAAAVRISLARWSTYRVTAC